MSDAIVFVDHDLVGHDLGLYDNRDPDEPPVVALKVIDITALNDDQDRRSLILYAKTVRGRLIQFAEWYPGENYGTTVHFYLDEDVLPIVTFQHVAARHGMYPESFLDLVSRYAPVLFTS